jgi:DNA helicase-2/ATP-dependent DNA helicase PcrA
LQGKHRNITAVGDPDQMIYTWRGARMANLMDFEQDFPGVHIVTLDRNYRSSANILHVSGHCVSHNALRHEKTLWTERGPGEPVVVRDFSDPYEEGDWVAEKVAELIDDGGSPGEIAVFYRTKSQSMPLEDGFAQLALPHQVVDSVGFFDRKEVKDLRAYLQLISNPRDDEACLRVINTPSRGIGAKTIEKLQGEARRRGMSLLQMAQAGDEVASLGARAKAAVGRFANLVTRLAGLQTDLAGEVLAKVVEMTAYVERQSETDDGDVKEIVTQFLGYANDYDERHHGGGLLGFLEQAALVSDVDGWNAEASAVPFMTLHSAKGLEFDNVFIVGLEEDLLPHRRALEDHPHDTDTAALEEERRLFYVGMTRARRRLFLTRSRKRTLQGRQQTMVPSRFLNELPKDGVHWVRPPAVESVADRRGATRGSSYTLAKKPSPLQLQEEGDTLARGARIRHKTYGEGEVIEANPMGSRYVVRVNFFEHGPMVLVLASEDVSPAG